MAEIILNVDVREGVGTGSARAVRRSGAVPGILYGGDKAPVAISVNEKDFRKSLYTGKLLGHLVTLQYGKEKQPVIAKDVQMHPVNDEPMHFDLYRVDAHQQIKIAVPIHFTGQDVSPGLKRGGTINYVRHDIEVECPADQIPEDLKFDISGLDIGDSIHVSQFALPKGVTAVLAGDFVVAAIAGTSAQAAEDAAADGAAAGPTAES